MVSSNKNKPARSLLRRWLFRAAKAAGLCFVLGIGLLHAAAYYFSLHDRAMSGYAQRMIRPPGGPTLRVYERLQEGADINIVFIHGTPASGAVFGEQFRQPFPGANLYALDRPGFGESGPGPDLPSLDFQAGAVGELLARIDPHPVILVGHSYGAPVALAAALKLTNRVAAAVLVGGSIDPGLEKTFLVQRVADWPIFAWLLPRTLRQCNRELLSLKNDLLVLQPRLGQINVPWIMLHGSLDRQVPVANTEYGHRAMQVAGKEALFKAMVFRGYNHFIPWEHPAAMDEALREAAGRVRSGRGAGETKTGLGTAAGR